MPTATRTGSDGLDSPAGAGRSGTGANFDCGGTRSEEGRESDGRNRKRRCRPRHGQALMDLIARLVQADRELALISIAEEPDPRKVAKAMDEIAKGDADRDTDKP